MGKLIRISTAALLLLSAACTTSQQTVPPLAGPSEFALSLKVTATPDSISKDGASQSAIAVNAFDANGKGISGLALRVDMAVDGTVVDFGTLSARTIVTNTNGQASTVYTAPLPSPVDGGIGSVVTIVATPTSNNFQTVTPQIATIRLVPTGVILPPGGSPTAAFTMSPSNVTVNVPVVFDASTSKSTDGSPIATYAWNFGDGTSGTGKTVSHAFRSNDTFMVTLTVTTSRGLSASTSQTVSPAASSLTAAFTISPDKAVANQPLTFDATTSKVPAGAQIVDYMWTFGDNTDVLHTTSPVIQHTYFVPSDGTFTATLTIADNFGNTSSTKLSFSVVGVGKPALAAFTWSPIPGTPNVPVTFDASLSGPGGPNNGSIVSHTWDFGDNTGILGTGPQFGGSIVPHTYTKPGNYIVTLTVTTNTGATGSVTHTVLVQ